MFLISKKGVCHFGVVSTFLIHFPTHSSCHLIFCIAIALQHPLLFSTGLTSFINDFTITIILQQCLLLFCARGSSFIDDILVTIITTMKQYVFFFSAQVTGVIDDFTFTVPLKHCLTIFSIRVTSFINDLTKFKYLISFLFIIHCHLNIPGDVSFFIRRGIMNILRDISVTTVDCDKVVLNVLIIFLGINFIRVSEKDFNIIPISLHELITTITSLLKSFKQFIFLID
nr:hypothetical protein BaRGS_027338 [Batillaria attramentaria]